MENRVFLKGIGLFLIYAILLILASCGPVVISSRPSHPPPPWFYPNRLEVVRYIYFPEISIYYDLSAQTYLYLDGGIWVRGNQLPPRYRNFNLSRSRYNRIRDYQDDNIQRYHEDHNANRGRSNRTVRPGRSG
jgi:hypothetical protein